jgi:hypothetical protein
MQDQSSDAADMRSQLDYLLSRTDPVATDVSRSKGGNHRVTLDKYGSARVTLSWSAEEGVIPKPRRDLEALDISVLVAHDQEGVTSTDASNRIFRDGYCGGHFDATFSCRVGYSDFNYLS